MMNDPTLNIPRMLDDGLLLRWATLDDMETIAEFNVSIHGNPAIPEEGLGYLTRELMGGGHPTTSATDFTVVVDTNDGDKLVSTACTISQTWRYEQIPFGVGRPELIGTLPEYRRRRLVRAQMELLHALSAARGELVQGITGIPWYYRRFGYEMALDLYGAYRLDWHRVAQLAEDKEEAYCLRPAAFEDIPLLRTLYEIHCRPYLISRVRSEDEWAYELTGTDPKSDIHRAFQIIETRDGHPIGYVEATPRQWARGMKVEELAVLPGHSLRGAAEFLARTWQKEAEAWEAEWEQRALGVYFSLGRDHPVYRALGRQLHRLGQPYAWYTRVPDLSAFLGHVTPVLEERLAGSVMAGHSGGLRLNFYIDHLKLTFENGRLADIGSYDSGYLHDGDAQFPDLTFLQLLFGRRSFQELDDTYADCFASDEAAVLLDILFPKKPSLVNMLG